MVRHTFARTTEGLRDALMAEMEDIRDGIATPDEANAFSGLARQVVDSLQADLAKEMFEHRKIEDIEERKVRREQIKLKKMEQHNRRIMLENKISEIPFIPHLEEAHVSL